MSVHVKLIFCRWQYWTKTGSHKRHWQWGFMLVSNKLPVNMLRFLFPLRNWIHKAPCVEGYGHEFSWTLDTVNLFYYSIIIGNISKHSTISYNIITSQFIKIHISNFHNFQNLVQIKSSIANRTFWYTSSRQSTPYAFSIWTVECKELD